MPGQTDQNTGSHDESANTQRRIFSRVKNRLSHAHTQRHSRFVRQLEADPWGYIDQLFHGGMRTFNIGANLMGILVLVLYFMFFDNVLAMTKVPYFFFFPAIMFLLIGTATMLISKLWLVDIAITARAYKEGRQPDEKTRLKAQQKIMDFPVQISINSIGAWTISAVIITGYRHYHLTGMTPGAPAWGQDIKTFIGIMAAGVITAAIVYFISEVICQRVRPYFFLEGESAHKAGRFKPTLKTRLLINFILTSLVPLLLMAVLSYNKVKLMLISDPDVVMQSLFGLTVFILVCAFLVSFAMSHLLEHSIMGPIDDLEEAMAKVQDGDFSARLKVASNDEIGMLAERFNAMSAGLKEGERLRHSLALAREVQQSLLPQNVPDIPGLDVAGRSLYCDETGGDYFDFLEEPDRKRLSVVIADVAEHGIPSALLMATVRALIRECLDQDGDPAHATGAVNRALTKDVDESGRFVTLFLMRIEPEQHRVNWVSAGHDPALLYDPETDVFEELTGRGPALGVLETFDYRSYSGAINPGQIMVLATDGVWEAHGNGDPLFGKERFRDIVRSNASKPAREILESVLMAVTEYCRPYGMQDDVTLIIIKILPSGNAIS